MRTEQLPRILGLIVLSLLAGCVGGPSWNRMARHPQRTTTAPTISLGEETSSLDTASSSEAVIADSNSESGGQFDVSSRIPREQFEPIEAPAPRRRSNNLPSNFTPTEPREFSSAAGSRPIPQPMNDPNLISTGYQSTSASTESKVEQVVGINDGGHSLSDPSNSWNQRRDMTHQLSNQVSVTGNVADSSTGGGHAGDLPTITPGPRQAAWPTLPVRPPETPAWNPEVRQATEVSPASVRPGDPEPWQKRTPVRSPNLPADANVGGPTRGSLMMPQQWLNELNSNSQTPLGIPSIGDRQAATPATNRVFPNPPDQHNASIQFTNAEQSPTPMGSNAQLEFLASNGVQSFPTTGPTAANLPPSNPMMPQSSSIGTTADLERLIAVTNLEVAAMTPGNSELERQAFLRKHVQLRLMQLMVGQTDKALQPVPGLDAVDQEFWQQMLWGVANYFDTQGMPDSSERASQTVAQLQAAALRLQEKARLELHNVAFCHKISGFGNYQRFKRDEFTPGQPVLLYAEVTNFKSEPTPDGQHRTLMKSLVEVLESGPRGRVVESIPFPPPEDRCRNQRRDYFHSYEFAVPQTCNPGPHTLRLTVEDQLGKKTTVATLNFTVQ